MSKLNLANIRKGYDKASLTYRKFIEDLNNENVSLESIKQNYKSLHEYMIENVAKAPDGYSFNIIPDVIGTLNKTGMKRVVKEKSLLLNYTFFHNILTEYKLSENEKAELYTFAYDVIKTKLKEIDEVCNELTEKGISINDMLGYRYSEEDVDFGFDIDDVTFKKLNKAFDEAVDNYSTFRMALQLCLMSIEPKNIMKLNDLLASNKINIQALATEVSMINPVFNIHSYISKCDVNDIINLTRFLATLSFCRVSLNFTVTGKIDLQARQGCASKLKALAISKEHDGSKIIIDLLVSILANNELRFSIEVTEKQIKTDVTFDLLYRTWHFLTNLSNSIAGMLYLDFETLTSFCSLLSREHCDMPILLKLQNPLTYAKQKPMITEMLESIYETTKVFVLLPDDGNKDVIRYPKKYISEFLSNRLNYSVSDFKYSFTVTDDRYDRQINNYQFVSLDMLSLLFCETDMWKKLTLNTILELKSACVDYIVDDKDIDYSYDPYITFYNYRLGLLEISKLQGVIRLLPNCDKKEEYEQVMSEAIHNLSLDYINYKSIGYNQSAFISTRGVLDNFHTSDIYNPVINTVLETLATEKDMKLNLSNFTREEQIVLACCDATFELYRENRIADIDVFEKLVNELFEEDASHLLAK